MMKFIVTRDIDKEECPWLDETIRANTIVYWYGGYTYGCIGDGGIAVTLEPEQTPFFELPFDSIQKFIER